MNSQEGDGEGSAASQHGRPCHGCRKRKVRCDKMRPCSNCVRSKQLCTYESSDSALGSSRDVNNAAMSTDAELRERLERLEALMKSMMVGETTPGRLGTSSPEFSNPSLRGSTTPTLTAPGTQQYQTGISAVFSGVERSPNQNESGAPVGQILFQDGYSAYFDSDFWPGLITEVEDLRQLFDDPITDNNSSSHWTSMSVLGMPSPLSGSEFGLAHPSIEESNMLCKYFFETVNPFTRALHSSLFARELSMYRRGTFHLPHEFEALLFSIYTLTVNSLRAEVVERIFSTSKDDLLSRLKVSTQVALTRIYFHKTEKIHGLGALLHYLTFLFQQNLYRDAVPLLSIAVRLAQNMGIQRDARHFPFSPWVTEIRARIWNHICILDAQAIAYYGAESCLPPTSDCLPPRNANDRDWHASRFANPSSVPPNVLGFKDMTFALVHREIADATRLLATIDGTDLDKRHKILSQVEASLSQKYLGRIDRANPSQTVIAALVEVRLSSLRLCLRHRQTETLKVHPSDPQRHQVFLAAVELLEAITYHISSFTPLNCEWLFSTPVPFLATSIALTDMRHATRQNDKERAQRQIDNVFSRFSSSPVASTKMWKVLIELRRNMMDEGTHSSTQVLVGGGTVGSCESTTMPGDTGGGAGSGAAAFGFGDDLMLDFGGGGTGPGRRDGDGDGTYDEFAMMGDLQNLPWYAWTEGGSR
ncbi:hypothetical protein ONS95_003584 [Cadophora gregata]|uniref:uncharacterized protein n=1 Tax=Cadophora gregata TaxID=51156 RepID=UPI0026DB4CDD|nr:uncharacterized protein ONS95_003584 [Cadophora gregata]KAK0106862.1 hypothetical protein ONS95_003584 [Cadophora gregata]